MHVDAASGGFVAPFLHPDLKWDFRLPLVKSINASGHKYGLVYPGVGWVVWRSHEDLPEDLVFHVNYLGGDMPTFTLNFSRPATRSSASTTTSCAWAGPATRRSWRCCATPRWPVQASPRSARSSCQRRQRHPGLRVQAQDEVTRYSVFDVSDKLREFGWQVPAYTMPEHAEDVAVLRIVVREGFSARHGEPCLLADIDKAVKHFDGLTGHTPKAPAPLFAH